MSVVSVVSTPMSPPLCNTWRPRSSMNQTGKIRKKKFLCVWSAAMELTTTDCPWCIIDTDSVLRMTEDISVFRSLQDIVIVPLWQFRLQSLFARTQIYLLTIISSFFKWQTSFVYFSQIGLLLLEWTFWPAIWCSGCQSLAQCTCESGSFCSFPPTLPFL